MEKRVTKKKIEQEDIPLYDLIDGEKVYNLCTDEANADPIRAARLLRSGKTEDLAKLRKMENTPMKRQKRKK
jgi:hypothetical protein